MGKEDWKNDIELAIWLLDSAPSPKAVVGKKFDTQYKFVIQKYTGEVEVKKFVPEWALDIYISILNDDKNVKNFTYEIYYKPSK